MLRLLVGVLAAYVASGANCGCGSGQYYECQSGKPELVHEGGAKVYDIDGSWEKGCRECAMKARDAWYASNTRTRCYYCVYGWGISLWAGGRDTATLGHVPGTIFCEPGTSRGELAVADELEVAEGALGWRAKYGAAQYAAAAALAAAALSASVMLAAGACSKGKAESGAGSMAQ